MDEKSCLTCGERLMVDGPMGWVHQTRSAFGLDGHLVVPVSPEIVTNPRG